jgi:hypothetical protein
VEVLGWEERWLGGDFWAKVKVILSVFLGGLGL